MFRKKRATKHDFRTTRRLPQSQLILDEGRHQDLHRIYVKRQLDPVLDIRHDANELVLVNTLGELELLALDESLLGDVPIVDVDDGDVAEVDWLDVLAPKRRRK